MWEICDQAFGLLFQHLVTPDDQVGRAAFHSYIAIRTFEGRLALVRSAGRAYFNDSKETPLAKQFWKLCGEALNYAGRRNEIAHGVVMPFVWTDPKATERRSWQEKTQKYIARYGKNPPFETALYPSYANGDKRTFYGLPTYCYTSVEIKYYSKHFHQLLGRVSDLTKTLEEEHRASRKTPVLPLGE